MATIADCTGFVAKAGVLKDLLRASNDNDLMPRLSAVPWRLPKRPWIVKTESNVKRERRKRPDPPCVICEGNGRVNCSHCRGRGRTNFKEIAMLPKGEWPKWCKSCGGSGLTYCLRCLGTGEYRESIGFHFLRTEAGTAKQRGFGKQPEIR